MRKETKKCEKESWTESARVAKGMQVNAHICRPELPDAFHVPVYPPPVVLIIYYNLLILLAVTLSSFPAIEIARSKITE